MFNNFLNLSGMSDKEIEKKIQETRHRIRMAGMAQVDYDIIKQMYGIIEMCYLELEERAAHKEYLAIKAQPDGCVFNLDSYIEEARQSDEPEPETTSGLQW